MELNETAVRQLLESVAAQETSVEDALLKLRMQPFEDIDFAKVDHHRALRTGIAEVIYGEGKDAEQIIAITKAMLDKGQERVLITRLSAEKKDAVAKEIPLRYWEKGRIAMTGEMPEPDGAGTILIMTAGTSDMAVGEEAAVTAQALGNRVKCLYDVGVAGLERLLAQLPDIMEASVIIAIAGMEGALPTVVSGLCSCPVVAVPTSVGYGTALHGGSALLTMLNSCAGGMAVENIDNGFGAALFASRINHVGH